MTDYYSASSTDLMLFEKYAAELSDWMKPNPGTLFKVGGKSKGSNRHQDATHYDRKYFDTDNSYIFSGGLVDSRQAAWLELKLVQFAYSLGLGVNDNRSSPRNMATPTGSPYSWSNPGCVYLVPVHATIATQAHYFAVHVSHHLVVKQLIAGGDHVKGTHLNPGLHKPSKEQNPEVRKPNKKQNPALRKKYKDKERAP
jgi:hypothetical protein